MARRQLWVVPDFQTRMVKQWALLVFASTLLTQCITLAFLWFQDRRLQGEYLYVGHKLDNFPIVADPTSVRLYDIVLPSLFTALAIGFVMSVLAGIYYSHRLAGPIYRIRRTLRDALEGKAPEPIVLRKSDEFKELAEDINHLLQKRG